MTPGRRAALRTHLGDAFERAHAEAPRKRAVSRLAVVGLVGLVAYAGLVVDAVKRGPEAALIKR